MTFFSLILIRVSIESFQFHAFVKYFSYNPCFQSYPRTRKLSGLIFFFANLSKTIFDFSFEIQFLKESKSKIVYYFKRTFKPSFSKFLSTKIIKFFVVLEDKRQKDNHVPATRLYMISVFFMQFH